MEKEEIIKIVARDLGNNVYQIGNWLTVIIQSDSIEEVREYANKALLAVQAANITINNIKGK